MRGLAKAVAKLTAVRRAIGEAGASADDHHLNTLTDFGSNPGQLVARTFVPENLRNGAALVVVLHGCTQNASIYDIGSGWSQLAEREGFALLFPEQQRSNNPNLCFNWYTPKDARRNRGEAMSISQMVTHMTALHGIDPARIYVTGLSAGGAMTSVMLATYPELFAGGAIIAGLPFASANSLPEALARMRGQNEPSRSQLELRARAATNHGGRFPTLSVWHGTRDSIVDPANADSIVDQWRDLHGLGTSRGMVETVDGHRRVVWRDSEGHDVIERYDVRGMGHGTPLAVGRGEPCGKAGPHMLDANICSTRRIAAFWGLTAAVTDRRTPRRDMDAAPTGQCQKPAIASTLAGERERHVGSIIDDALRAAGLMR